MGVDAERLRPATVALLLDHVALGVPDIEAGGRDDGPSGPREHYHPRYYGGFVLDPDGNNVEAVCR